MSGAPLGRVGRRRELCHTSFQSTNAALSVTSFVVRSDWRSSSAHHPHRGRRRFVVSDRPPPSGPEIDRRIRQPCRAERSAPPAPRGGWQEGRVCGSPPPTARPKPGRRSARALRAGTSPHHLDRRRRVSGLHPAASSNHESAHHQHEAEVTGAALRVRSMPFSALTAAEGGGSRRRPRWAASRCFERP